MSFRGRDGKWYAGWQKPVRPPKEGSRPPGLPFAPSPDKFPEVTLSALTHAWEERTALAGRVSVLTCVLDGLLETLERIGVSGTVNDVEDFDEARAEALAALSPLSAAP